MTPELIPAEIHQTPAAIRATLEETRADAAAAAAAMRKRGTRRIYLIGNGTSLYSSMAVAYSIAVARSHILFAPVTPKRCFQSLTQPTASPARPRAAISVRRALSPPERTPP